LAPFFLPPYSPALNPDESVRNDLKANGTGRKLITSFCQLRKMIVSHNATTAEAAIPGLQLFSRTGNPLCTRVMTIILGRLTIAPGSLRRPVVSCITVCKGEVRHAP
jgi:hypothetical protein